MALKHRYDRYQIASRPEPDETGTPVTIYDHINRKMVEGGTDLLLRKLKQEHPAIVDRLIRKNGDVSGNFSLLE